MSPARERPLTSRQQRFVDEYLIDLNGTQAAIRAGYAAGSADVSAAKLLGNARVSRSIAAAKEERAKKTGITQERVLRELELLAFSDHTHYEVDDDGHFKLAPHAPDGAHRAISSVKRRIIRDKDGGITREVEYKLWEKPGMVKLAGRHVGAQGFFDKLEVTGKDGGPVAVETSPAQRLTSDEQRQRLAELEKKARERLGEGEGKPATPTEP